MPALIRPLGALALLLLAAPGCRRAPVTEDECQRLLDRYTEQLARVDRPHLATVELEKLQAEARTRAATHGPFKDCPRQLSREQMDCALGAFNPDEIERCLVPVP